MADVTSVPDEPTDEQLVAEVSLAAGFPLKRQIVLSEDVVENITTRSYSS